TVRRNGRLGIEIRGAGRCPDINVIHAAAAIRRRPGEGDRRVNIHRADGRVAETRSRGEGNVVRIAPSSTDLRPDAGVQGLADRKRRHGPGGELSFAAVYQIVSPWRRADV